MNIGDSRNGSGTARVVLALKNMNDLNVLQQAIYSDPQGRVSIVAIAPTADTFQQNTLDLAPDVVVADARYAMDMGEQRFLQFIQNLPPSTVAVVVLPPEFGGMKNKLKAASDKVKEISPSPINAPALADRIFEVGWAHQAVQRQVQMDAAGGVPAMAMAYAPAPALAAQKVIAVAAFKGGPGKTTVAVNLWHFLNRRWGSAIAPSLLVGLDVPDDCTAQLGFTPPKTLVNFLSHPNERGLAGSIVESPDRYPLISMPDHPTQVTPFEEKAPELIKALLYSVRAREYLGIVVDLPPGFSDWTIEPMMMASLVLLVAEPDPANVRKVVVGMRELQRYTGIARNKFQLVVTKLPPGSPSSPREVQESIRQALGWDVPVVASIPYDVTVHEQQLQFRVPASSAPDSDFARAIERLGNALYPGLTGAKAHKSASLSSKLVGALRRL
jgi:MinD-like ATPase involved in chromosome partitioning or flagellar assembly